MRKHRLELYRREEPIIVSRWLGDGGKIVIIEHLPSGTGVLSIAEDKMVVRRGHHLAVEDTSAVTGAVIVRFALRFVAHARKAEAVEDVCALVVRFKSDNMSSTLIWGEVNSKPTWVRVHGGRHGKECAVRNCDPIREREAVFRDNHARECDCPRKLSTSRFETREA